MVTKSNEGTNKKGKTKVGKLKLNRETVKELTATEQEKVKGGAVPRIPPTALSCATLCGPCNCAATSQNV